MYTMSVKDELKRVAWLLFDLVICCMCVVGLLVLMGWLDM